jgi:hypothetical protein
MTRKSKVARQDTISVSIDNCRVRMQTGEPTVYLDVRKDEDRAANPSQIVGSLRIASNDRTLQPPCHQHNYVVVYCA